MQSDPPGRRTRGSAHLFPPLRYDVAVPSLRSSLPVRPHVRRQEVEAEAPTDLVEVVRGHLSAQHTRRGEDGERTH